MYLIYKNVLNTDLLSNGIKIKVLFWLIELTNDEKEDAK
jgi:hypothetical protein